MLEEGEGFFPGTARRLYEGDLKRAALALKNEEAKKEKQLAEAARVTLAKKIIREEEEAFERQKKIPPAFQAHFDSTGKWPEGFSPKPWSPGIAQITEFAPPEEGVGVGVLQEQAAPVPDRNSLIDPVAVGAPPVTEDPARHEFEYGGQHTLGRANLETFSEWSDEKARLMEAQQASEATTGSTYLDPITGEERIIRSPQDISDEEARLEGVKKGREFSLQQKTDEIKKEEAVRNQAREADVLFELEERVRHNSDDAKAIMQELNRDMEEYKARADDPLKIFGFYDNEVIDKGERFSGKDRYETRAVFKPWAAARTVLAGIAVVANSLAQVAGKPGERPPNVAMNIVSGLLNADLQAQAKSLQGTSAAINQKMTLMGKSFALTGDINTAIGLVRAQRAIALEAKIAAIPENFAGYAEAKGLMLVQLEKAYQAGTAQVHKDLMENRASFQKAVTPIRKGILAIDKEYRDRIHEQIKAKIKRSRPLTMMDMGPKQQERIRKARSALGALLDITRLWRIYGHELHKRGILKHLLDPEYDPLKHSAFTGIGGPKGDSLSDWIKQEVGLRVTDKDILGLMEMHKNITKWASPISAPLEPGGALSDADALRHLSSLPGPGTPPDLGLNLLHSAIGGVHLAASPTFQGLEEHEQNSIIQAGVKTLGREFETAMSKDSQREWGDGMRLWNLRHSIMGDLAGPKPERQQ